MIGETFWVLSGSNLIDPYLSFFVPRAKNYSDDGETWHGSYGQRLYSHDQLIGVVETFRTDGKDTRRAFASITVPNLDSPSAIKEIYGKDHKPLDVPCNQLINFYIVDNKFHTKVIQRSGDFVFGSGSINPFEFTVLQELMFNEVKRLYPEIELGPYRWHVMNAHVYEGHYEQVNNVLTSYQPYIFEENEMWLKGPSVYKWEEFFSELLLLYSFIITDDTPDYESDMADLYNIFREYKVETSYNLLWEYAWIIVLYIHGKKGNKHAYDARDENFEFVSSIVNSKFRNFDVEV